MDNQTMRGFKVTDKDFTCRGFEYQLNKPYAYNGDISLCNAGFHFCQVANNCFNYYEFNTDNRVFEVEASGLIINGDDKSVTNNIIFLRELTWQEVLDIVNTGTGNTGRGNAGHDNAGNDNAGHANAGNYNAGHANAGNDNAGNANAGHANAGNRNAGHDNAGNRNAGNYNAGNRNAGNDNAGNDNAGNDNAGHANAGHANAGNANAGNYNAGNRNAGHANAGNDNAGAFNSQQAPYMMFNKPSKWKYEDFAASQAFRLLHSIDTTLWIPKEKMTDEEKEHYPYYVTTNGYVRQLDFKESFTNAWGNWSADARVEFTSMPNFDKKVFYETTGVKL